MILLLRHGATAGNLARRYEGCQTDAPLSPEGERALEGLTVPPVDRLFVSPMQRCVHSARILWPGMPQILVPGFREIDFGRFEGQTAEQLAGSPSWEAWLSSGGDAPFPGGESRAQMTARCLAAMPGVSPGERVAIVAHGGTLMALMEALAREKRPYFSWQTACATGYRLLEDGSWTRFPEP